MPRTPSARPRRGRTVQERASRRQQEDDHEIPEVYREMLAEADARESQTMQSDRPVKKRKTMDQTAPSQLSDRGSPEVQVLETAEDAGRQVQTVYDSPSSEESDMEWEEVDLQPTVSALPEAASTPTDTDGSLQITLDPHEGQKRRAIARRKPITAAERKLRLDIHKVHLLCLLRHVQIRNLYCNDEEVQRFLKRMLTKQITTLLNPSEDKPQYTRSTTFVDGLNQASEAFLRRFKVTKPGLKRAHWSDDSESLKQRMESIMADAEVIISKEDFRTQAKTLQGSRDFGAQLFCTLLRAVAVEARLVCSLQPLPFSGTTKNMTPIKPVSQEFLSEGRETSTDEQSPSKSSPRVSQIRRLGRPQFKASRPTKTVTIGSRPISRESAYPVFWVEAFNEAVQKWVPVDPLVTKSLAKSFKYEPPSSDPYNCMSYVVAFEEDASARDVTRRYAKAFNAKTRKLRVECTKNGERWWARVMRFYEKPFLEDRDEVEISELTAKTASEPMPRNVQDFKDHPIYALERHLRRNEVIHPKRATGQVGLGKSGSKNEKLEPVYRRSDVHVLRSANKWYRVGRDIKVGEQPLKRVRKNRQAVVAMEDDGDPEADEETPLYAAFQTELYTPPPIIQGKVPKNVYGNLDVYTPSMVPAGGVHIKNDGAARAARILGIDFADAVTGFEFRGRHGTAVIQGIVVAGEYHEALVEVLNALEDERAQAEQEERSAEVLRTWKHFLLKLRIAERVKAYAVEGDDANDDMSLDDDPEYEEPEEHLGGGFFPDPTAKTSILDPGPSIEDDVQQDPISEPVTVPDTIPHWDDHLGGGFIPDEKDDEVKPSEPTKTAPVEKTTRYSLIIVPKHEAEVPAKRSSEGTEGIREEPMNDMPEQPAGSLESPITVESSIAPDSKSASVEIISRPVSQVQSRAESPAPSEKGSQSEYEGSLLSEDPEDEDAIPEWLM